jgi:hypothetical protein
MYLRDKVSHSSSQFQKEIRLDSAEENILGSSSLTIKAVDVRFIAHHVIHFASFKTSVNAKIQHPVAANPFHYTSLFPFLFPFSLIKY